MNQPGGFAADFLQVRQAARAERFARLTSGKIGDPMPKSGIICGNSTPETGDQAPAIPVKLQTVAISKKIFSMRLRKHSGTGLVQQTVQIVARFAITI